MKTRQCFVANSSSSSFVCEICGASETVMDGCAEDVGMIYCENEHLICDEHRLNSDDMENDDYGRVIPESACPICQFQEYSQHDMVEYLKQIYKVDWAEVFAKIKEVNKRRKKLYNHEYITEVLTRNDLSDTAILATWRETYKTYAEFKEVLRKNR